LRGGKVDPLDDHREESSAMETTDVNPGSSARAGVTAPVSHQKRAKRSATNAIGLKQKHRKINEADRYSAAHKV
jgi:hypothetical protein